MKEFLSQFIVEGGLLAVAVGSPAKTRHYKSIDDVPILPTTKDVYFAPASRNADGDEKKDVLGTKVLWVDADDPRKPLYTLPPSMMVFSGHGWHLYWLLDEPLYDVELIEQLNKLLAEDIPTGDTSCFNANRVLRVPGTTNNKDEPVVVSLRSNLPVHYTQDDILVLEKLDSKTRHKIRTGDSRGYRSRSERDWAIITNLVAAGADERLIRTIFANQPCGDKFRDSPDTYLTHTIERAMKSPAVAVAKKRKNGEVKPEYDTRDDGYYYSSSRGVIRISTFTIDPTLLLDGSQFQSEDAIVGNVHAGGYEWPDVTFTRSAFTSVRAIDKECPVAAWQWVGTDSHVRQLLPHLLEQLKEKGLPRVVGTEMLGMHKLDDKYYFIGTDQVISSDDFWSGFEGPVAWLPSKKEHPKLNLSLTVTPEAREAYRDLVPKLNEPEVMWPVIGWYTAAFFKPWLEERGYRFPILSVVGTKGSGKTTLLQRVMMPLFGQYDGKSYDSGTTRFVILALLGSSNAVPIAFSEFRYESVEKFLRYVLLSYDTGHDPRGRSDQTTVDYPLSAPFSIDGEDLIADPAARERIVVAHLDPAVVLEGSESHSAYKRFQQRFPANAAGYLIRSALERISSGNMDDILEQANRDLHSAFPQRMPDRIRNNHVVVLTGVRLYCDTFGCGQVEANVLERSISSLYSLDAQRSRTMVDDMVEDICNSAAAGTSSFRWEYDKAGILYFQMASAHSWWLTVRRRQGRGALERDALRSQLREAPYSVPIAKVRGVLMVGVKLQAAQDAGLDVPDYMNVKELRIKF